MFANCTRRRFLKSTAAATLGAGFPLTSRAQGSAKYLFSIGIQSFSLRGFSAEDAIKHASDLGCDHIEFYPTHFSPKANPGEINSNEADDGCLWHENVGAWRA